MTIVLQTALRSFTLLRSHSPPHLRRHFSLLTTNINHHNQPQPSRNALRARETLKQLSSLSLSAPTNDNPQTLGPNQAIGMVASAQANFMRVIVNQKDNSTLALLCVVRAVLKKIKRRVLVGDRVFVGSIDWVGRRGRIENVLHRDSEIVDPPIANADHVLVVFSMDQPKVEPFALTRFLVEAESIGIPVSLALNKCELVSQELLVAWKSRLRQWGYVPIFCSAELEHGLDSLAFALRGRTTVIVGPSGVGKSSLINVLRNTDHFRPDAAEENLFDPISGSKWFGEQQVGEVSARSGRGKHTTRNVSLLPLSGRGYLADTPGFSQPSLLKVTMYSLAQAFPEIQKILEENEPKICTFNNCMHVGEPGCVVGGDWERFQYYFQLLDEIKVREEFQLRTLGTKKEGDVRNKVGDMGVMQAEPKLEPKKHRRQSRKKLNQSILDELDELDEDDDDDDLEDNPIIRAMELEHQ